MSCCPWQTPLPPRDHSARLLTPCHTFCSLAGFIFLLGFLSWSSYILPHASAARGGALSRALWGSVAGLSALLLLLQLVVQAAFALHAPGMARPAISTALSLLGFSRAQSPADLLLAFLPMLLALVASALQVQSGRDADVAARRAQSQGTELQPLRRGPRMAATASILMLTAFSNAGVAAGVALVAVALARPALFALPFDLALAASVWRWGGGGSGSGGSRGSGGVQRGLQSYAGASLAVLYIWQAALRYLPWLAPLADLLGLFAPAAGRPAAELAPEVVQLSALVVLSLALGFVTKQRRSARARLAGGEAEAAEAAVESRGLTLLSWVLNVSSEQEEQQEQEQQWQQQSGDSAAAASTAEGQGQLEAGEEGEGAPLLNELGPRGAPPPPPERPPPPPLTAAAPGPPVRLRGLLLPLACEAALTAAEQLCRRPAVAATLLALYSLMQPSLLGGLLLLACLAALLSPAGFGAGAFVARAQVLSGLLLTWQLAAYCMTAVSALLPLPRWLSVAGLHDFSGAGPLAWAPLLAMLAAAGAAAGLARGACSGGGLAPPRPAAGGAVGRAWALVCSSALRLLWYSGLVALPAAQFVVGTSHYSLLHGIYLAGLLEAMLARTLALQPPLRAVSRVASSRRCRGRPDRRLLLPARCRTVPSIGAATRRPHHCRLFCLVRAMACCAATRRSIWLLSTRFTSPPFPACRPA